MRTYQILRFYDFYHDAEAARISMFDHRGDEYWTVVAKPGSGPAWRAAREKAIDALVAAMDQRQPAGEVIVDNQPARVQT